MIWPNFVVKLFLNDLGEFWVYLFISFGTGVIAGRFLKILRWEYVNIWNRNISTVYKIKKKNMRLKLISIYRKIVNN